MRTTATWRSWQFWFPTRAKKHDVLHPTQEGFISTTPPWSRHTLTRANRKETALTPGNVSPHSDWQVNGRQQHPGIPGRVQRMTQGGGIVDRSRYAGRIMCSFWRVWGVCYWWTGLKDYLSALIPNTIMIRLCHGEAIKHTHSLQSSLPCLFITTAETRLIRANTLGSMRNN